MRVVASVMIYTLSVMICKGWLSTLDDIRRTLCVDDIPSLRLGYKKRQVEPCLFLELEMGFEPTAY